MACRVVVSRTSPDDVQQRQMIVKIDGEEIATLMYGQTTTHEVEPGPHRITVDNTWVWKTVAFSVGPDEEVRFRIINRAGRFTWWLVSMLGAGPMYVTIEREA